MSGGRKPNLRLHYYVETYDMSESAVRRLGGAKYLDSLGDGARMILLNQFKKYQLRQVVGRRRKAA